MTRSLIAEGDWDALQHRLSLMSNAQFREFSSSLGASVTDAWPDEKYWLFFTAMVRMNAKAFLGTLLKQVARRMASGTLDVMSPSGLQAMNEMRGRTIDVQKTAQALLPLMDSPERADKILTALEVTEARERIALLLKCATLPCSYLLFLTLRKEEHDRTLLVKTAYYLIRRGDSVSFNLASLLKCYFALEEVKGTFSLSLHPYQLARLEQNYEAFVKAIDN